MAKRGCGCSGLGATPKRALTRQEREKVQESRAWNAGQRFALKNPCYLQQHANDRNADHLYGEFMSRLGGNQYFDVFKYGALDVWKRKRNTAKCSAGRTTLRRIK